MITTVLGGLATLFVAYRILNQPGQNDVVQVKIGAWLGLLFCAGITVGGYLAMRDEGTTFDQALSSARESIPVRPAAAGRGGLLGAAAVRSAPAGSRRPATPSPRQRPPRPSRLRPAPAGRGAAASDGLLSVRFRSVGGD